MSRDQRPRLPPKWVESPSTRTSTSPEVPVVAIASSAPTAACVSAATASAAATSPASVAPTTASLRYALSGS